jgi:queuosine biosynthesis protein QueC
MRSVVLLSGGMDSATLLGRVLQSGAGDDTVNAISFRYGQRHEKEIHAASDLCAHYDLPHEVIDVALPRAGSVLMTDKAMPQMSYEELQAAEGPSPTYVPFRNGTFLSLAAAYALDLGADTLHTAVHADDGHNWAYPDCTPEFVGAMQNAIYVGTYHEVRLQAPFVYLTKAEIVALGTLLRVPFDLTWSCYEGREFACGTCPTCVSRLEAFDQAGLKDPIPYERTPA